MRLWYLFYWRAAKWWLTAFTKMLVLSLHVSSVPRKHLLPGHNTKKIPPRPLSLFRSFSRSLSLWGEPGRRKRARDRVKDRHKKETDRHRKWDGERETMKNKDSQFFLLYFCFRFLTLCYKRTAFLRFQFYFLSIFTSFSSDLWASEILAWLCGGRVSSL